MKEEHFCLFFSVEKYQFYEKKENLNSIILPTACCLRFPTLNKRNKKEKENKKMRKSGRREINK